MRQHESPTRFSARRPNLNFTADFDLSLTSYALASSRSAASTYTVEQGDTLQAIASKLWGDASLWWKLADVNGLTSESTLVEGQMLIIPVGVQTNANSATTFRPYDPLEVLGNLSPTSPKPAQHKLRGFWRSFTIIMAMVIAAWVTSVTAGAASGFFQGLFAQMGLSQITTTTIVAATGEVIVTQTGAAVVAGAIAGAAVGGAAGSIASQSVLVAGGVQDKFSWNEVGMAAIGAAVGATLGALGDSVRALSSPALQAVLGSAITQGIGVATGLQKDFSWAAVAAAGAGALASGGIKGNLTRMLKNDRELPLSERRFPASFGEDDIKMIGIGANLLASAAARSVIEGSDFGDNVIAALPNVIGQTIGNAVAGSISSGGFGRGIGKAFAAIGDTLGFDGQVGYEGPANRAERRLTAALDALEPQGDGADFPTTREVLEVRREVDRARGNETALQRILGVILGRGGRFSALGLATMLHGDSGPPPMEHVVLSDDRGYRLTRGLRSNSENLLVESWGDNEWQPVGVATEASRGVFVIDDSAAIADYTGRDLLNTVVAPGKMGDSRVQVGFGIETRNQDELDIVSNGLAARRSSNDIHNDIQVYRWRTSGVAGGARPPGDIFAVGNHGDWGPRSPWYEGHHGVMSAWVDANFQGYNANLAPSILMPTSNHRDASALYPTWRADQRQKMGGTFDWTRVSEGDMRVLANRQMDAARVPQPTRDLYWQRYDAMMQRLRDNGR